MRLATDGEELIDKLFYRCVVDYRIDWDKTKGEVPVDQSLKLGSCLLRELGYVMKDVFETLKTASEARSPPLRETHEKLNAMH